MNRQQTANALNHTWIVWPLALLLLLIGMGCRGECDINYPDDVRFFNGCGGTTIGAFDLSGKDLTGLYIENTSFYGGNLTKVNLEGSYLRGVDLTQANVEGANLTNVSWADAICPDGTSSIDVGFNCCNHLNGAVPASCSARTGQDFQGEDLSELKSLYGWFYLANMAEANMSNARIIKGNFLGANLTGAVLTNTVLNDSDFSYANLSGADLSGAILDDAFFVDSNLENANLENADLNNTHLQSNLTGANLNGAILSGLGWYNVICPDGTHSNDNGYTCCGHLNGAVPSSGCN